MTDIIMIEGGICGECNHEQKYHESNTVCAVEGCDCTNIGNY